MSESCFYIKRKNETYSSQSAVQSHPPAPTDLPPKSPKIAPEKAPPTSPSDLPLPRHRPGEPLMYDPPVSGVETFPLTFPDQEKLI